MNCKIISSVKLLSEFIVDLNETDNVDSVQISLFDDNLLFSLHGVTDLYINNRYGQFISNVTINNFEKFSLRGKFSEAIYTRNGNIVRITDEQVILITAKGELLSQTLLPLPHSLSITSDGIIYFIIYDRYIYRSTDNGRSWDVVFQLKNDVIQFMVVPTSENDDKIWVRDSDKLHIYCVNWAKSTDVVKWKDVCISYINYRRIDMLSIMMLHDGINNVLLAVRNENLLLLYTVNGEYLGLLPLLYTVNGEYLGLLPLLYTVNGEYLGLLPLLYTVNGEYLGLLPLLYTANGEYLGLLPLLGFEASPTSFAVDRQHNLLFVGCKEARVRVFQFLF